MSRRGLRQKRIPVALEWNPDLHNDNAKRVVLYWTAYLPCGSHRETLTRFDDGRVLKAHVFRRTPRKSLFHGTSACAKQAAELL
jgi:hypothetical protein